VSAERYIAALHGSFEWPTVPTFDLEVAYLAAVSRAKVSRGLAGIYALHDGRLTLVATVDAQGRREPPLPIQCSMPLQPSTAR